MFESRQARQLPELIRQLEPGQANLGEQIQARDLTNQQLESSAKLIALSEERLGQARYYLAELQEIGQIADPAFKAWMKVVKPYARLTNMSLEEIRSGV